jgi:hypothetical protein
MSNLSLSNLKSNNARVVVVDGDPYLVYGGVIKALSVRTLFRLVVSVVKQKVRSLVQQAKG